MKLFGKILVLLCIIFSVIPQNIEAVEIPDEYVPRIYGTLRPRFEWATSDGEARFQIRNSRIGLEGKLISSVAYRAEVDLCDRGVIKCLDVWARLHFSKNFAIQLGQMRMPFSMGSARAPHQYYFANRATTDKQAGSPRQTGVKFIYNMTQIPLIVEAGAYNTSAITNHSVWQRHIGYAGKIKYTIADHLTLLTGAQSLCPDTVRINHLSGAVSWHTDRWLIEGEYIYRHPTHHVYRASHAYCFMIDYGFPVTVGDFNRLSFQGRLDGMTSLWDGKSKYMDPARNRATLGVTLSYVKGVKRVDIRLNYEQCYFHHDVTPTPEEGSKLIAEIVVRI